MGTITMSRKEARRPGLIQAAIDEKITNEEGARALGLSPRQFSAVGYAGGPFGGEEPGTALPRRNFSDTRIRSSSVAP